MCCDHDLDPRFEVNKGQETIMMRRIEINMGRIMI